MRLNDLTDLIIALNSMLDSGEHEDISVADVRAHINDGELFQYLLNQDPDNLRLEHLVQSNEELKYKLLSYYRNIDAGYGNKVSGKWGVENNGLCLLIGWTASLIEAGPGWQPNENLMQDS